jgi:large subunit ribosomal protein L28
LAGRCQLCGKTGSYGNNVSHSKRRTTRRWAPNVQKTRLIVDGEVIPAFLCTRCIRTQAKQNA